MIFLDEIIPLKLYRKNFYLPINLKNKKTNSVVFLLGKNVDNNIQLSTNKILNNPLLNKKYFESYYIEKDVNYYINNEGYLMKLSDKTTSINEDSLDNFGTIFGANSALSAKHYKNTKGDEDPYLKDNINDVDNDNYLDADDESDTEKKVEEPKEHPLSKYLINTGDEIVLSAKNKGVNLWDEINRNKDELFFELYFKEYDDKYISPRSRLTLSKFTISKLTNNDNKDRRFSHIRFGKDYDCRVFYDKDSVVGYVNVNKSNHTIQAMEITPEYQGKGLGSQLLRYAIKTLKATNLTVNKKNKVAINMYKKNGFVSYDENKYIWFMKLDNTSVIKEQVVTEASTYEILDSFMNMIKQAQIDEYKRQCQERVMKNNVMLENCIMEGNLEQELIPDQFIGKLSNECDEYFELVDENGSLIIGMQDSIQSVEENDNQYKGKIHTLLYNDRYKTPKEVIAQYDKVKTDNPDIKYTFLNLKKYNEKNLLVDLSFYNTTFLNNNTVKGDNGVNLYRHFLRRLLLDKRLDSYNKKTVIIPLEDVLTMRSDLKYTNNLNILSCIIRIIENNESELLEDFKNINFVILSDQGYMMFNMDTLDKTTIQKFQRLLIGLLEKDPIVDDSSKDSKQAILADITDKIEKSQGIKIHNLTGKSGDKSIDDVVNVISNVASKSVSEDETLDKLNDADDVDNFKNLVLKAAETSGEVKLSASRQSRLNNIHDQFMNINIKNKTVKELLTPDTKYEKVLPSISIKQKLDTVNEEWSDLKFINFNEVYDPNEDILAILNSLSKHKYPIMVRDIQIDDTSTSEDLIETWTCKMEDSFGQRFTFIFDIPKFEDKMFMFLRGNRKKISGQYTLIPISKTDLDTAQIVTNYKKMFIRRYGLSSAGKSYPTADLIYKTLSKNEFKDLKITFGDNSKICNKYELPMDYIDLAGVYNKFETKNVIIYFNQDEIREKYKDSIDDNKGVPYMVIKSDNKIMYWDNTISPLSDTINAQLRVDLKEYGDIYDSQKRSTKYFYSQVSILASKIPLIVMIGYNEGLTKVLDKSKIVYNIQQKRPSINDFEDFIKFKDGYIVYTLTYESSLLMNGLKDCNTEDYSLTEIDSQTMWLDFLDIFGGRILADGLDNFYELMIDVITEQVLERYNLPTDYVSLCLLANKLLIDNKYIDHTNPESNRYRSNELLAGYAYQCIATSYGDYKTSIKKGRQQPMSMKRTAIIDAVMADNTCGDKSIISEVRDWEDMCAFSYKGLSGMNNDRSYSLDKRTYNKSMTNLVALSTGFAGNVGVNRQCTIDANIEGKRGYLKIDPSENSMSVTKSFCPTEALTPFGTTSDDPFRSAMTFIQTGSHSMRVKKGFPNLVTNGADQAMPYFTSNTFSYNSKMDGKVVELTDSYMILEYIDGSHDFISLEEKVEKNSNGGIFLTIKLDPCVKLGQKIKQRDIVAYDKLSYSNKIGYGDILTYSGFTLCKSAIQNTEEGYEDSTVVSEWLSDALASDVVLKREINMSKDAIVLSMVKKGQPVKEGDSLLVFQNSYDQEDVNMLLKNLAEDEETLSELGRIPIKSNVEGVVQDIKIYRTVEIEDLSESLQKIVNDYEKPIKQKRKIMAKYNINDKTKLDADYKLEPTGKLKNLDEGVKIEILLKYEDKFSVGDKLSYNSALKGVCKGVYPKGKEPYTKFRPDEKIHVVTSIGGVLARMVGSVQKVGGINKGLIELDRKIKDMCGIKWKYLEDIMDDYK